MIFTPTQLTFSQKTYLLKCDLLILYLQSSGDQPDVVDCDLTNKNLPTWLPTLFVCRLGSTICHCNFTCGVLNVEAVLVVNYYLQIHFGNFLTKFINLIP